MKKLVLIHFQPIEKYPPVMNMINVLGVMEDLQCIVFSMKAVDPWFNSPTNCKLVRWGRVSNQAIARYVGYIKFNIFSLIQLLFTKPTAIIAYETYSLWPVYWYQKWNKSVRVHLHYHEYVSPEENQNSSIYLKYLHQLEQKLWSHKATLSHTNSDRMDLFLRDNTFIDRKHTLIWPNYPPLSWLAVAREQKNITHTETIKLVHVGAVGMATMYIEEMVNWVIAQEGKYSLAFITDNIDEQAKSFLDTQTSELILVRAGVNYFELPKVLLKYDMGLTLYNGHIPNHTYSVPNKVMEYLVCGLPVAYSKELISTRKFINEYQIANCVELDFSDLTGLQFQEKLKNTFTLPEQIVLLMNNQKQDIKHFIQLMVSA
jgi:hypothetical protein